jgi:hypothetical protein
VLVGRVVLALAFLHYDEVVSNVSVLVSLCLMEHGRWCVYVAVRTRR